MIEPAHFHALLRPRVVGDGHFEGVSLPLDSPAIYGGQLMAQVLSCAARTLHEPRSAHYLQTSFLAFGDPKGPLDFAVGQSRDGRSTSHREVVVSQAGRTLVTGTVSFQAASDGYDHQLPAPAAQAPEALLENPDNVIDFSGEDGGEFPFLIVEEPADREPVSSIWVKSRHPAPDDSLLQQMLFAFASDATILQSAANPHELDWTDPGLIVATMNHTIWFHRALDVNRWLLLHGTSPSAAGGRGLSIANTFDSAGTLVATVAQEGVLRRRIQ